MNKDALKFFQSYITEMIDIGGENLPKSISSSLGTKLARIYKEMGITEIKEGLKKSYEVIKAKPKIEEIDPNTIMVNIKHKEKFCPIGGKPNPEKANLIQEHICTPYTMGFLNELNPNFSYFGDIEECILKSGNKECRYILKKEKKPE